MDRGQTVVSLQARKQALLLESRLNRLALQAEWQDLRAATGWVADAAQACRTVKPWLLLLAPVAGVLLGRGFLRSNGLLSRLVGLFKLIRPLLAVWKTLAGTERRVDAART